MDLRGLMCIESRGGKRCVFVVVNDFLRYSFMSFLREKSKTVEYLKSLFNIIQEEIGHLIVRIWSDRRKKFDNDDVDLFCESKCIKHEFSALRTPQKNEVTIKK